MARSRSQDYDIKRTAILHRAAELFAQHGYGGASINMIATACKVSKALLYHYYPDKEAVLFDMLNLHLTQLVEAAERAALAPQDRLYALCAALLETYRDADAEHQVQITALRQLPPERQEGLRELERRLVKIMSEVLAKEIPALGNGPLLKSAAMSAFGMLNWHYLWFRDGKGLTRDQYARFATQLILSGAAEAAAAISVNADQQPA